MQRGPGLPFNGRQRQSYSIDLPANMRMPESEPDKVAFDELYPEAENRGHGSCANYQ